MIQTILLEIPFRQALQTRCPLVLSTLLFAICLQVGCNMPNSLRYGSAGLPPERDDPGSSSERLTYARHTPSLSQEFSALQQRQNRNALLGRGNANGLRQSAATSLENTPVPRSLTARPDDPTEIVALIDLFNGTDRFRFEEKEEIIELLRQESPVMRSSMIANYRATLRSAEVEKRNAANVNAANAVTDNVNPIAQVSYQSPNQAVYMGENPMRRANLVRPDGFTAEKADYFNRNTHLSEPEGTFRQVSGLDAPNRSPVRINRLQSEWESPPRFYDDENDMADYDTTDRVAADDERYGLPVQNGTSAASNIPEPRHHEADMTTGRSGMPYASTRTSRESVPLGQLNASETEGARTRLGFADPGAANRSNATTPGFSPTPGGRNAAEFVPAEPGYAVSGRPSAAYDRDFDENEYEPVRPRNGTPANAANRYSDVYDGVFDSDYGDRYDDTYARETSRHDRIASVAPRRAENWDTTLRQALDSLNAQVIATGASSSDEQLQAEISQRLLCLVLGNQRDAIRPIESLSPELQEFWRNELLGLSTMLDDASIPDMSHRYAVAQHHLQAANLHLQSLCPVRIRNINFINQCDGFGVYETAKSEFRRGEPIFVYAEIDNLICREQESGYHTQVSSSYEIVDVLGNKVSTGEFSKTGKSTQSRIRDAFLLWRVDLPEHVNPGKYFLRISVSDLNHPNHQFDQQSLELDILPVLRNN